MDQETKDLLLKYLQAGADRIERGSAFVEAEIPLVVTEYLNWYWAATLFFLLLGALLLVGSFALFYFAPDTLKMARKSQRFEEELYVLGILQVLCGIGLCIGGVITMAEKTYQLVKVSVAPRVVLLEKIAEIAK